MLCKYQITRPRQCDVLSTLLLQCRANVQDIGPRINQQVRRINTWYNSTVQTKMTKVIRRQTPPFNYGTPLFFIYHYYKSFIKRFIQKNRIAVHTKNKKKIKVDEILHKFTRRQVSSELTYPKMYNIYIYTLRQVTSKQQVSKKIVFLICLFYNIVIV